MKIFKFLIVVFILSILLFNFPVHAQGGCVTGGEPACFPNLPPQTPSNPVVCARIPGVEFLPVTNCSKPGDLISSVYIFALSLVGISALIMLTIGGIKYMLSGDRDPTSAKEMMKNALIGLVIAFVSWLVLFTINPDLVRTLEINLTPIKAPTSATTATTSSDPGIYCVDINAIVVNCSDTARVVQCRRTVDDQGVPCPTGGQNPNPTTGTVGVGGPCVGASSNPGQMCVSGATCFVSFTDAANCRAANGNESGTCQTASCPVTIGLSQLGGVCDTTSACAAGLECKILVLTTTNTQQRCSTATAATGGGRCMPTNCKANGQNQCFGSDNCPSGSTCSPQGTCVAGLPPPPSPF